MRRRATQAAALKAVPGVTVLPGVAPYLLLRLPAGQGERVRAAPPHRWPAAQVQQLVRGLTAALAEVAA